MGTVGLSFGSPTSGTGFDVSSTVSMIVANLENVETPWKNQLSSLESQDTVLSNLGTLFSNLSNDISSLTDFTGVMSLKEGSSSNPDALEITGASSSAATGTYDVSIGALATTANLYTNAVSSASDTLTGAIEINGTTISVPDASTGNNTLQGLVNAINAADIGVTANILTDANGSRLTLTSNTSGSSGTITVATSGTDSSGNTLGLTDTSDSNTALTFNNTTATGSDATLTVNGVQLTSASNTATGLIPGVTLQLLGTTTSGSDVQVVIANDNSDVESTLYQFASDYNALVSAMNTQEGNDTSGNPEPLFGSPTLSLLQEQLFSALNFQNPSGYLDAVSSASDTLTGYLNITTGTGSDATTTKVSVPATGSGEDNLAGLAAAINSSSAGVTANIVNNGSGPQLVLVPNTEGTALSVSSAVTDTTTSTALSYNNSSGGITALTDLGISMNNDGTISLDETSLDSVLNSDYSGVVAFFQNANSWGMTFSTVLTNAGTSSPTGVLSLAENSNSAIESTLNAEVSREEALISTQQVSLTTELNSANEVLQELPTQLQGINEMYSAITGYNENSNG